jgi:hypothetical protein
LIRILPVALLLLAALCIPASAQATGVRAGNWVWYYQQVQPTDAAKFVGARAVVVASQKDDAAAIAEIHAVRALAFHYVNAYWYPAGRAYQGLDIGQNVDFAFCDSGSDPLLGRTVDGFSWYYVDLNERGMFDSLVSYLDSLRAAGYDGVFFDLGTLALSSGAMPAKVSTCTSDPVVPIASFADSYAEVVKVAAAMGLRVTINYTTSQPLRWDIAAIVDRTLYETPPDTTLGAFDQSFARRRAEEAAGDGGAPRFVEEIKTITLNDRWSAFFEWAAGALWNIDLTINTGDDACAGSNPATLCTRYGTFPELTSVRRGSPLDAYPSSYRCEAGSTDRCLWLRRWRYALVVVNTTTAPIRITIRSGHRKCRVFTDVWRSRVLHRGACTGGLTVTVPALSGRVYTEAFHLS